MYLSHGWNVCLRLVRKLIQTKWEVEYEHICLIVMLIKLFRFIYYML